ncbi:MAG TPA: hypothetical protein VN894_12700 [Polyangiaceae bacterium]|nr:hypothetical protein [Polyangiaceae bacterium]
MDPARPDNLDSLPFEERITKRYETEERRLDDLRRGYEGHRRLVLHRELGVDIDAPLAADVEDTCEALALMAYALENASATATLNMLRAAKGKG